MNEDIDFFKRFMGVVLIAIGLTIAILTPLSIIVEDNGGGQRLEAVHSPKELVGVPEEQIIEKNGTKYIIKDN